MLTSHLVMGATRLMLMEFYFPDRYSQFRSKNYPFLLGQARDLGVEAKWLCCWAPAGRKSWERYIIKLAGAEQRELSEAIRSFDPTHLIVSEKMEEGLEAEVRRACPRAHIENLAEAPLERIVAWPEAWLPGFLQTGGGDAGPLLVDTCQPVYDCEAVNARAELPKPPVHVSAGVDCAYHQRLNTNRFFKDLKLPEGVRGFGCSFCVGPLDLRYRFKTPEVELALRQCTAALHTGGDCLAGTDFVISGAVIFARLDRFFDGILKNPFPPSRFFFGCRIDDLLKHAGTVERLLPRLAAAGHSINIFNLGIENFSQAENDRLNKGLTLQTVETGDRLIRRLEQAYPETFQFSKLGGYGIILFTPWTTLDDLAINLEHLERFFGVGDRGFYLSSKLQILSESAIRYLAERDGLILDSFDGFHFYDSGCIFRHDQRELPWRFLHPEVARLYEIACRIAPLDDFPDEDELLPAVQEVFERGQQSGRTTLELFGEAVEFVRSHPDASPGAILDGLGLPRRETRPRGLMPEGARRLKEILDRLEREGSLLDSYRPVRVWETRDRPPQLAMELHRGEERLVLYLLEKAEVPAFLATRRFLLRYHEETPVDTADKERVAQAIAAHIERNGLEKRGQIQTMTRDEVARMVERAPGKEALEGTQ